MNISKILGKGLDYTYRKPLANALKLADENPARFAANTLVLSLVSKDAINCALYTYQSYNNERIPEDKRKFVASLDLVQGFFNVGLQLYVYGLIKDKFTPHVFNSSLGKKFSPSLMEKYTNELKQKFKNADTATIEKMLKKTLSEKNGKYISLKTGSSLIVALLATNALCKRTLTPMLATPIAAKMKQGLDRRAKRDAEKKSKEQTEKATIKQETTIAKQEPAAVVEKPQQSALSPKANSENFFKKA